MAGRHKLYATDEERHIAVLAAKKRSAAKVKNITVDADLAALLNDACDLLEPQFGFRPTISQTLRHLLKKVLER